MIKYNLLCEIDHEFEGWFRSSSDFDVQADEGLLSCPACGSAEVRKAVMSPAIAKPRAAAQERRLAQVKASMAEAVGRARDYVEKNFDYVGDRFPEEARQMHYGEKKSRGIYGEASGKEVKELLKEGVDVAPMPAVEKTDTAGKPIERDAKKKLN